MRDRAALTADNFAAAVGSDFTVVAPAVGLLHLRLADLMLLRERPGFRRPFALRFRGPASAALAQGIYRLAHAELGEFEISLVPIAADSESTTYEAIFS